MQVIQGTNAGGRLGEVLGTGLNQLAQHKLAQLSKQYEAQSERNQFAQGLVPLLGQDTANFLSNLGPDERKYALQNLSSLMQLNQQPGQQQPALRALQPGQQPQEQAQKEEQTQQLTPERAKLLEDVFTSPQERREREKLELAKRQAGLKERESLIKETKTYVDTLKDKEKASKEGNLRLRRMETLIDKGNLPNAALWSALSKLEHAPFISGLTAPFAELLKGAVKWKSGNAADIEEFEKLSTEFVKNAKQYFGPRITQQEVQLFMQTIPTLMATDAGKKKLIENMVF